MLLFTLQNWHRVNLYTEAVPCVLIPHNKQNKQSKFVWVLVCVRVWGGAHLYSAILCSPAVLFSPLSSSAALQQCYSPLSSSANLRSPAVLISALQQCYSLLSSSAILCSPADSLCSCHMWFWMSDCSLLMCIFSNIHQSGVLTVLSGCCMAGAMWNYCCLGSLSVYTIQPCTSSQCHFTQSHLGRMHVCLAANQPPALLAEWQGFFVCIRNCSTCCVAAGHPPAPLPEGQWPIWINLPCLGL